MGKSPFLQSSPRRDTMNSAEEPYFPEGFYLAARPGVQPGRAFFILLASFPLLVGWMINKRKIFRFQTPNVFLLG